MYALADVPLSVLDVSPIVSGSTARVALHNTVDLARFTENLGYHRYWVPEHHSMRGVASSAPAVLISQLATMTTRIRVGSGGVLLPNHAPIVIAEQFGTVEVFHPHRIDLGIGRAPGGNRHAADAVRSIEERSAKSFPEQLDELQGYFEMHREKGIRAIPAEGNRPSIWLLGSSAASAQLAGSRGLSYAYAHHLNPAGAMTALQSYRESFRPSQNQQSPNALISVSVIAADSDDEAQWLAGPSKLKFLGRKHGRRILLPTPVEAAAYPYTEEDRIHIDARFAHVAIGSSRTVGKDLQMLLDTTGAHELMVTTQVYDHGDRRRSYQLVAELARAQPTSGTARRPLTPSGPS